MRSAEGAELNDAVCSAVAHELGGIAGALDLRATALIRTIPPNDAAALRGLAEELRGSTRAVRLMRGPDASGTLNPSRTQTLVDWWRLASRLSRAVLPTGAIVNAVFDEGRLKAPHANALTWIWLSACKELAEASGSGGGTISLKGACDRGRLNFRAECAGTLVPAESRWSRHAAEVATTIEMPPPRWEADAGVVWWSFSLPASPD